MVVACLLLVIVATSAQTDYTEEKTEADLAPLVDIGLVEREVDIDNSNCPLGNSGNSAEYFAPSAWVQSEALPYHLAAHGEPNALEQSDSGHVQPIVQLIDSSSLAVESAGQFAVLVAFVESVAQPDVLVVFVESAVTGLYQR